MKLRVRKSWHDPLSGETREVKVGDILFFEAGSYGRGGHYLAHVKVIKINRKTIDAIECCRSYAVGTLWRVHEKTEALCLVEENHITPAEMHGVGVYRFRFETKPTKKQVKDFKASISQEEYDKILEEAMSIVTSFPHEYKSIY